MKATKVCRWKAVKGAPSGNFTSECGEFLNVGYVEVARAKVRFCPCCGKSVKYPRQRSTK